MDPMMHTQQMHSIAQCAMPTSPPPASLESQVSLKRVKLWGEYKENSVRIPECVHSDPPIAQRNACHNFIDCDDITVPGCSPTYTVQLPQIQYFFPDLFQASRELADDSKLLLVKLMVRHSIPVRAQQT